MIEWIWTHLPCAIVQTDSLLAQNDSTHVEIFDFTNPSLSPHLSPAPCLCLTSMQVFHKNERDENLSLLEWCASHGSPKGKYVKSSEVSMNTRIVFWFFLNLCYKMAITGLFSLFSVMNSFAYAEIVAAACWGRPANACINAFGGTWSRSTLWSR